MITLVKMFWSKSPIVVWSKNDSITTFESAIYKDETHTRPLNLKGMQVVVRIRSDDIDKIVVFETNAILNLNEKFSFKFKKGEIPDIGLWKIEFFISKGNKIIGMTHHDDFNVEGQS